VSRCELIRSLVLNQTCRRCLATAPHWNYWATRLIAPHTIMFCSSFKLGRAVQDDTAGQGINLAVASRQVTLAVCSFEILPQYL
jgi:hypothetical protein